ncbi:MAG: hypothetical protein JJU34_11480 [Lunatimonas sp.]|uniref:hypothetical protein n=1 Tax=Lunatimonas sp. TaxID=2060141 RepID=UPI00263A852A|nr:hypothetical protein [Lunatimonas sp.]MCC5937892.1 hypothetical protein [Lunatimonas sp.]
MKRFQLLLVCCILIGKISAQSIEWQLVSSISPGVIDLLATDRNSHVFVADKEGNIRQYNSAGDSVNVYSPPFRSKLTNLETQWTVNLFLFSADLQQFELLDRFLRPITTASIRDHDLGVIRQATLGNGNTIWMVDETRLSLVKWDYRRQIILQEQPFSLILDNDLHSILNIAERKNLLFLHSQGKGVLIFDNQANLITRLQDIPDTELYFTDDFVYYFDQQKAYRTAYTTKQTESFDLPNTTYQKMAVSPTRIFFSTGSRVDIFKKPSTW